MQGAQEYGNKSFLAFKTRRGFSLIELVVVIIIIAILVVAIFAGGSVVIKKAQISRAKSDLHNFDIALTSYMFEDKAPGRLSASSTKTEYDAIVSEVNRNLPKDYSLDGVITLPVSADGGQIYSDVIGQYIYSSQKTDPWGNPYYFLIDQEPRNENSTEYFMAVLSAGSNAKANVGGVLDNDDIFLLCQYTDGSVVNHIYNMNSDKKDMSGAELIAGTSTLFGTAGTTQPINFINAPSESEDSPGTNEKPHINSDTAKMFLTKEILERIAGLDYQYNVINSNEPYSQNGATQRFIDYERENGFDLSDFGAKTWQIYARDATVNAFLSEPAIYWSSIDISSENLGKNIPVIGFRAGKYDVYCATVVQYNSGSTNEYISIRNNFAKVFECPKNDDGHATFQFDSFDEAKEVYNAILERYNENGNLSKNDMKEFGLE